MSIRTRIQNKAEATKTINQNLPQDITGVVIGVNKIKFEDQPVEKIQEALQKLTDYFELSNIDGEIIATF